MCGLTGFWSPGSIGDDAQELVRRMALTLRERGPDSEGAWLDRPAGIALGHSRLAILDLSAEGHQPMISPSGRYVIVYNGEVYNYRDLRKQLDAVSPGIPWRGGSDTEVMLAAIETWGLESALQRFLGMFAFALWDRERRVLQLVRDRLGIKPLVYGRAGRSLVFGSTLQALRAHPDFDAELDRSALAAYLRFNCVPAPHTIHRDAKKVRPGTIVTFRSSNDEGRSDAYWSAEQVWTQARPFEGDEREAIDTLEATLRDAVRLRMIADVPVGAFLSGGIDSSVVVALMQEESARPVRTYSIGNERADYDEGGSAALVAQHLRTVHTQLIVNSAEALSLIPTLPGMYDEPFADSSQIPTFMVARLARREVAVALSGDGGDELFGGYNRHLWGPRVWRILRAIPSPLRAIIARPVLAQDAETLNRRLAPLGARLGVRLPGDKLQKLARVLPAYDAEALYAQLQTHWDSPTRLVLGVDGEAARPPAAHTPRDLATRMMLGDLVGYLPDDILTKVDRASMAVSLEARVPLLDHRVVELAARLPLRMKIRHGAGKHILRELLARHVPRSLWERPKMGFGVPLADWLRGPLRPWAEDQLAEARLRREGVLDAVAVRSHWRAFADQGRGDAHNLWDILMFQSWHEHTLASTLPQPTTAGTAGVRARRVSLR
jgi:asparagine synthase (glutamine-hydrolysing)